jgi:molybdate/tungstate transport system substrate-binding protein
MTGGAVPRRLLLAATAGALLWAAGCGPGRARPGGRGTVAVFSAASLQDLMRGRLGPGFERASGYRLQGYPGGSQALANEISGRLQRADVFISAAPGVNGSLMGSAHGGWVDWYVAFGTSPLLIGYNPRSRFAAALRRGPWYEVMAEAGFRLGRTDPQLDPKGALTIQLVQAAARYYHVPDLEARVLGGAENPRQVFPEQELLGRLQAGQLDAGFFYSTEIVEAHLPAVAPAAAIDPAATFTVAALRGAPDPAGAAAFVAYLLGPAGQAILAQGGVRPLHPLRVTGAAADLPAPVAAAVRASGA